MDATLYSVAFAPFALTLIPLVLMGVASVVGDLVSFIDSRRGR